VSRRLTYLSLCLAWGTCLLAFLTTAGVASAGTLTLHSCSKYADNALDSELNDGVGGSQSTVPVWQVLTSPSFSPANRCGVNPAGGSFQINPAAPPKRDSKGQWTTVSPKQIEIVAAYVPADWILVDSVLKQDGFKAAFFWSAGNQRIYPGSDCCGGMAYASQQLNKTFSPSRYFGFAVTCELATCGDPNQILDVRGVQLTGEDTTKPTITPLGTNIIYANGRWVRGNGWSASFQASADDGICNMKELIGGVWVQGPVSTPNHGSWTQCPTPVSQYNTIDTTEYPNGPLSIYYGAADAATPANVSAPGATVEIDNVTPSINLSGPADALATSGTQYVTATATAGPSGVGGIACSLDGAPWQRYDAATVRVAVSGVGEHSVSCFAINRAIDPSGQPATSPTETFHLDIQEPTVSSISFARIADALRCRKSYRRILIPAQTVTEHYHHRKIKVRIPAHRKRIRVLHCHARVVYRRVKIGRHWVTRRIVLLPHQVRVSAKRVAFGRSTTVSGWLGTIQGNALGGQRVAILSAPNNGSERFSLAGTATTQPSGNWQMRLPPGPSRLIEVVFPGSSALAATVSAPVTLIVPASLTLSLHPRVTHWTGTIWISGRLRGGYIPPSGELVVLKVGWRGGSAEIGHLYVGADGRFRVGYTFLRGSGTETYRIWASSARESDYPYAPASSHKVVVEVR
jgi:hypothetical protein